MVIQENDFLKLYNEMNKLWEDIDDTTEAAEVLVEIKGCVYKVETPFMTIEDFLAKNYCTSGIYLWKRLPYGDKREPLYYVGKAKNIHKRTIEHIDARQRDSVALHAAIRKHKEETGDLSRFNVAILEFCIDDKLVFKQKETDWIAALGTFENRDDFNLTPGGDGGNTRNKVTQEMYNEIVQHLINTGPGALTEAQLAREYTVSEKTIRNINQGRHFRCPEENKYKQIRSDEEIAKVAQAAEKAQQEKEKAEAAIPHVVYKDAAMNYYYFPTTTEAAEWAVLTGCYTTTKVARDRIKHRTRFETLNDFINNHRCQWGILNTVPDQTTSAGGFTGEVITDDQGKKLGIKLQPTI